MLRYSISLFFIAIVAAIFGFSNVAVGAASFAKIIFFIFLALFVMSMLVGATFLKKKMKAKERFQMHR